MLGNYGSGRDIGGPGTVTAARLAAADAAPALAAAGFAPEILAADHLNKPDVAASLARAWFDTQGVDCITDLAVTPVALAVVQIASQKRRSVLVTGAVASDLTDTACSAISTHWADDTDALANSLGPALVRAGGKTWFVIAVDYSLGTAMLRDIARAVGSAGGRIIGTTRFPFNATDFASALLQAQSSGADIVAMVSTGDDTVNAVRQFAEFALAPRQRLVSLLTWLSDISAIGLPTAQGLPVAEQFYWDDTSATREFATRFFAIEQRMPTRLHAATHAAVLHYLTTIAAIGEKDALAVNAAMRARPVDFFAQPARIRANGRVVYDLGLYQVKTPAESHGPWDLYRRTAIIPASQAFPPEAGSACKLG